MAMTVSAVDATLTGRVSDAVDSHWVDLAGVLSAAAYGTWMRGAVRQKLDDLTRRGVIESRSGFNTAGNRVHQWRRRPLNVVEARNFVA